MSRLERRARQRIRCESAAAYLTFEQRTVPAVVADLSLHGVGLRCGDRPAPGARVALSLTLPPQALAASGRIAWADGPHATVGVELALDGGAAAHELLAAMIALAGEADADRPAALLLVDDPALAARLCNPLRRHGYLPRAVTTALDAAVCLTRERPEVRVAVVTPRAGGLPAAAVLEYLAADHPDIVRLAVLAPGEPAPGALHHALSVANAERELEALLAAARP